MPEGPEIKIITEWLAKNFTGTKIINNSKYPQVNGATIQEVTCKGKQIFFCLTSGTTTTPAKAYLNSRLALEGKWTLTEAKHTRFWMYLTRYSAVYDTSTQSIKILETPLVLYNDDTRNFGAVDLLDENGFRNKINQIGPDLLSESIDYALWVQKIKNRRIPTKQICDYLLEQKYFSGIGNYLKAEILYRCRIRPDRQLNQLTDDEIKSLFEVSIATIKEAYSYHGLTIRTYWSPEGHRGVFPLKVYNRDIDDNGYKVIKGTFDDDRTTHWVPEVQK